MRVNIDVRLVYDFAQQTDLLLQIEAAAGHGQSIVDARIDAPGATHFARVAAQDGIGERVWMQIGQRLDCTYRATIDVARPDVDLATLAAVPPHLLPGETVRYLMPSRFCPADEFQSYVGAEFDGLGGGALVAAMRDWIGEKLAYVPGSSGSKTTALETFVQRQGVCRDFAHLLITLARASAIPARFASVYAPGVTPPDFHAVAEVFLDGGWHLVDATGMASPSTIAVIGVGADAAEVSFLTSYGGAMLIEQSVSVVRSDGQSAVGQEVSGHRVATSQAM